ncbi:DUF4898 domain-containing protein [Sulfurisphaera javensis]|uniref:DUF4898 domain-containing protein n=1 Tax=Sulfurisphaera javensis TaxID=2049879 RepID=A0AAT9GT92_9CREN
MTVSLKGLVEENIVEINDRLGFNTCWLYNFKWVNDLSKFILALLARNKELSIIIPTSREDRDVLINHIRKIANQHKASITILLSDKIAESNFLVCIKQN